MGRAEKQTQCYWLANRELQEKGPAMTGLPVHTLPTGIVYTDQGSKLYTKLKSTWLFASKVQSAEQVCTRADKYMYMGALENSYNKS